MLNETKEDIKLKRNRHLYSLVHLYRLTLVINYSKFYPFTEKVYSNCVVRCLVVVMFKLCDHNVACL